MKTVIVNVASGGTMNHTAMRGLLGLAGHEEALCFLAFGTPASEKAAPERARPEQYYSVL